MCRVETEQELGFKRRKLFWLLLYLPKSSTWNRKPLGSPLSSLCYSPRHIPQWHFHPSVGKSCFFSGFYMPSLRIGAHHLLLGLMEHSLYAGLWTYHFSWVISSELHLTLVRPVRSQAIGITNSVMLKAVKDFLYLTTSYLRSGTVFIIHFHIQQFLASIWCLRNVHRINEWIDSLRENKAKGRKRMQCW